MAVRRLCSISPGSCTPPDSTTGNLPAALSRTKGSQSAPASFDVVGLFDASQVEYLHSSRIEVPADFVTFASAQVHWTANATSGTCVWLIRVAAITEGDTDTPYEHAYATANSGSEAANATEARRLVKTPITMSNGDGVAVGDLVKFLIGRDATNGSDTLAVDAELLSVEIFYNDA